MTADGLPSPRDTARETQLGIAPPPLRQDGDVDAQARRTRQEPEPGVPREVVKLGPGITVPGTSYRVTGWLGDGAMGVVYRAQHVELEREVALKILRPEASSSPDFAELFRREAKNASKIGSHYIVEVYDLGELTDGRVWFTMPLLEGRSLRSLMDEGPIEPGRAIGILRQMCKALAAAHAKGIIHRDVKPENVMVVTDRGRPNAVRMLDWGVAALNSDAALGMGVAAGTPYYIAPEVVSGLPFDDRADLYSLGCTAFEMLAGRPPFTGGSLDDILLKHVQAPIPRLRDHADQPIPDMLDEVIARCLAKAPTERYDDATELEAGLCEAQIAGKLRSTWDDLPLPEIDPERRARIAAKMPDPVDLRPVNRRWPAFAFAGVLALGAVGTWFVVRDPVTAQDLDEIETLADEARAAASRALYLFPPPEHPDATTAYGVVLRMEQLEGSARKAGETRARELREEFAGTLARLGDYYWERDGGRPFAIDYYAQALVFMPDHDRARERASVTPGEIADLRDRAREQRFSQGELVAAKSLTALAQEDPAERARGLAEIADDAQTSPLAANQLGALIAADPELEAAVDKAPRTKTRARSKPEAESADASATPVERETDGIDTAGTAETDGAGTGGADGGTDLTEVLQDAPVEDTRDREAARAEVKVAEAALARGDLAKARAAYERAINHDDRFAAPYDGLCRLEFHRGNYAKAARHGEKAVRLASRDATMRLHLGDAYYKAYRYDRAKVQYAKAKELGDSRADARLKKAEAKLGG